MITGLKPGDVLCIADDTRAGWFIRLRGKLPWMKGQAPLSPGKFSHIAVVMHTDKHGLPWGIEGKPSRVEFVDLTKYLTHPGTLSNKRQPKTDEQRTKIAAYMLALYAAKYDWNAIVQLGAATFGSYALWLAQEWRGKNVPKSVICSSAADAAYEACDLPSPGGSDTTRLSTPDTWGDFILRNNWGEACE